METCAQSEEAGGLGLQLFHDRNIALLAKHAWRMTYDTEALWIRVLKSKYLQTRDILEAVNLEFYNPSSTWRAICAGINTIKRGLRWSLGSGQDINFWTDLWCPFSPLLQHVLVPHTRVNIEDKVAKYISDTGWNLAVLSQHLPPHVLHALPYMLCDLDKQIPDSRYWGHTINGQYTVSSVFSTLDYHPKWQGAFIWKMKIPPRTKTLLWLLLHKQLLCNDYRRHCRLTDSSQCSICSNGDETIDHIFRHCSNALEVWIQC